MEARSEETAAARRSLGQGAAHEGADVQDEGDSSTREGAEPLRKEKRKAAGEFTVDLWPRSKAVTENSRSGANNKGGVEGSGSGSVSIIEGEIAARRSDKTNEIGSQRTRERS